MGNQPYKLKNILPVLVKHSMPHIAESQKTDLGITLPFHNDQDLYDHIVQTLFHQETRSFSEDNSRDCFYNPLTNTVVIINFALDRNGNTFGGTCFRPREKEEYFKELYKRENRRQRTKEPSSRQ